VAPGVPAWEVVEDVMFHRRDVMLGATAKVGAQPFPVLEVHNDEEDDGGWPSCKNAQRLGRIASVNDKDLER
jgi:hypothetical protein